MTDDDAPLLDPPPPASSSVGKRWRDRLRPIVEKIEPVARITERVANFAVQLQKPMTVLGAVGIASSAIAGLRDVLNNGANPASSAEMMANRAWIVEAFRAVGGVVRRDPVDAGAEITSITAAGQCLRIFADGSLMPEGHWTPELQKWIRQVLDPVLPQVLSVKNDPGRETYLSSAGKLAGIRSPQAERILAATRPLCGDGGRCILIEGKPGVGKTTAAHAIAQAAGFGRVLLLDGMVVGTARTEYASTSPTSIACGDFGLSLALVSPGVIVVDDVDKIHMTLKTVEAMRSAAKLVVLTANNGMHDEVLDGAMMRAGRVDEVFSVTPEHTERRAPFDQLGDAEWDEVSQWPIAYVNEVERRLRCRPGDLRLEDLRGRLKRRTRSGDVLSGD